jgi:hypothetical protein
MALPPGVEGGNIDCADAGMGLPRGASGDSSMRVNSPGSEGAESGELLAEAAMGDDACCACMRRVNSPGCDDGGGGVA